MTYIFITGGVLSGLGKGILAASLANLLKFKMNLNVGIIKIDPYLNVDSGTMNPDQHGEVFVTEDGKETDLDLGHYERFLDENLTHESCVTLGSIYANIINSERIGQDYLGKTIQVVPHITNAIIEKINKVSEGKDIVIIEIGGTVGDIESEPVLKAIKSLEQKEKCIHIHLSKLDCETGQIKTKPIQNSIIELGRHCILPDILVVRAYKYLTDKEKEHIVEKIDSVKYILFGESVENVYDLPTYFEAQNILNILALKIGLSYSAKKIEYKKWNPISNGIKIAIAEKYGELDSHISIREALRHIEIMENRRIEIEFLYIDNDFNEAIWNGYDGIIIPGSFGSRAMENKISLANYARKNNIPVLGICMGMQIMCIEFARSVCGIKNATSEEFENDRIVSPEYIIHLMKDQNYVNKIGGTMRLGAYRCNLMCDSIAYEVYKTINVSERHRHRYEFNNEYKKILSEKGLKFSGFNQNLDVVEIIELDTETHPFFVGVQFHPEFKSRFNKPHPLFVKFFEAVNKNKEGIINE